MLTASPAIFRESSKGQGIVNSEECLPRAATQKVTALEQHAGGVLAQASSVYSRSPFTVRQRRTNDTLDPWEKGVQYS